MSVDSPQSKFRINLVPIQTKVKVCDKQGFKIFELHLTEDIKSDFFDLLCKSINSILFIKKDLSQIAAKEDKEYYYCLETSKGIIRFEINYGGKYDVDKNHPPTISIETKPYIPNEEFLLQIKEVVKLLIKKTGFKLFFWDALDFLKVDEIYGTKKNN